MTDDELAVIIDELKGKSQEEIDKGISDNGLTTEDAEIVLAGIEAIQNEIDEIKDFVEKKTEDKPEETSGADETLTEDLSEPGDTIDVDGDGSDDAVVVEKEEKHGGEDKPHAEGVIRPVNILKALGAFKY